MRKNIRAQHPPHHVAIGAVVLVVMVHCMIANAAFINFNAKSNVNASVKNKIASVETSKSYRRHATFASSAGPLFFVSSRSRSISPLYGSTDDDEEPLLTELDARVLQSMLAQDKLNLDTEANMKKLLERGIASKTPETTAPKDDIDDDDVESEFSSTIIKALTDTKLYTQLKAKAEEAFESAQIYVANRIERDSQLLASVGIFAWERAKRDVSRALPASGRSGAAVGRAMRIAVRQLGNTSSFDEGAFLEKQEQFQEQQRIREEQKTSEQYLYDEIVTPLDEIKSVTSSIRDILTGNSVESVVKGAVSQTRSRRGLRSVAPAGQSNLKERQQRAYQRQKQSILKEEKEGAPNKFGRAAGGFVEAAWEMKQELKTEAAKPGYKTQGVRNFINAAKMETTRSIEAARQQQQRLLGRDVEQPRVIGAGVESESIISARQKAEQLAKEVSEELKKEAVVEERERILSSLRLCLASPEEVWLFPEVLLLGVEDGSPIEIDDQALREVVTAMIVARDTLEMDDMDVEAKESNELIDELKQINISIEKIVSLGACAAGKAAAESLSDVLYGRQEGQEDQLLLLQNLNEIDSIFAPQPEQFLTAFTGVEEVQSVKEAKEKARLNSWFMDPVIDDTVDYAVNNAVDIGDVSPIFFQIDDDDVSAVLEAASPEVISDAVAIPGMTEETNINDGGQYSDVLSADDDVAPTMFAEDAVVTNVYVENTRNINDISNVADNAEFEFDEATMLSSSTEVVPDEDFENAFGNIKSVAAVSDGEANAEEKQMADTEQPLPILFVFRFFDVLFFILEKFFTVGIPGLFAIGGVASKRISESNKSGLGSKGWKRVENTDDGAKRY